MPLANVSCTAPIHSSLSGLQIEVKGVDGPLKDAAEKVLTMKPNFSYTLQEVEDEVAHVFELGWFAKCQPNAEDTRDGVKITIEVPHLHHIVELLDCHFNRLISHHTGGSKPRVTCKALLSLCQMNLSMLLKCNHSQS